MERPRLRAELEARFDGPQPPHLLAQARAEETAFNALPLVMQQAAMICDAVKMVASYRKVALETLADRRQAWALIRSEARPLAEHVRLLRQFQDGPDRSARQWVKRYLAARQLLAKFRAEMAELDVVRAAE